MCGIAGFTDLAFDGSTVDRNAALVHRMCDVIRHRGPDDEGIHVEDGVALGMRRLSIIDLATGRQPIHNEDHTVWVVFNGEIYNYRELRRDLESAGHRFYTSSDTETIAHAYEEWGDAAFSRLRGMFAIAVWDRPARTLLLARDRAGIKPLHYAERDGRLYFGSEIKCLLAGAISRELDPLALDHYLAFLYAPRDRAMFKGVRKLAPGHYLRWKDGRLDIRQYWQIPETETFRGSDRDAAVQLRHVLTDAVRSHLMSDVPLGAFLSGGVDSSLVVGLMAEASDRPVKTFSIGFDEPRFDELAHARRVAAHFGTDHHEFVVRPEGLAILDRLVEHFDEPFADSSAIPTWYVSEMARRHVTVVLSGDGGDELFGGYDRYFPHPNVRRFDRLPIPGRHALAAGLWPRLPHGAYGRNLLRHVGLDEDGRYLDSLVFFHADERRALYARDFADEVDGSPAERVLAARLERFRGLPARSRMMRLDFETYLPEDVLTKVDRMSMAHSIESRVPLLDNRVIDFAATVPPGIKLANGRQKHLLKEVARAILPAGIVDRPKHGFGVPLGVWFRGGLTDFLRQVLTDRRTRQRAYFSPAFVDRLVREHVGGRRDHSLRLWQLLVFELWHRHYLDTAEPSKSEADHPTRAARYTLTSSAT
jgi:asparagine synthase (glutamine-hydrolysing)